MKVGVILSKLAHNQPEAKASKPSSAGTNFSNALMEIGKNITSFIPKINANAKTYEANIKKIKTTSETVKGEIPTLEDEADKLLKRIEGMLEKYDHKKKK